MILTQEQRRVYDAILAVRTQKREKRLLPDFCLSVELVHHLGPQNACKAAEIAGELEKKGIIRIGRTLNYQYYEITSPEPDIKIEEPENENLLF